MKRAGLRDEVRDIEQFLGVIVAGLDPDAVPLGEAKDVWVEFDKVERLAHSAKTSPGAAGRGSRYLEA